MRAAAGTAISVQILQNLENGGFAKKSFRMVALDTLSEDYLLTVAMATHKTPTEIISELVREKIAASALQWTNQFENF